MKIIICGAGEVGFNLARILATEGNDVTVIDKQPALIEKLSERLDVQGIVGFASLPNVLDRAGARDADLLIAATYSDEVNIVACEVAHALFDVPTKIARIREPEYLDPMWGDLFSQSNVPIDVIISPEIAVADAIVRRFAIPGVFDAIPLAAGKVTLIGVRCDPDCPVVNTPLRELSELFPELHITVVGIVRADRKIVPTGDDNMLPGDEVYVVAETAHLKRALLAFGHEEANARRVLIVGGGHIGQHVAEKLEADFPDLDVKLIEVQRSRAEVLATQLKRTIVMHGDALDSDLLHEANVAQTETMIAVSNDDEVNILSSLLAKRFGCRRSIALVNAPVYTPLMGTLGIDAVVNPRNITASTILQHVRRGRIRSVHTLSDGFGEIIEGEAVETSSLVGPPLRETDLPPGVVVGALIRNGTVIIPRGDTTVRAGDEVVLFAAIDAVKKVKNLFAVRLEYF
jgi:trk system potassium uptake protein TrkA